MSDLEAFWGAVWAYFEVASDTPYERVLGDRSMPGARWFEGARVNYAEHMLRHEASAAPGEVVFAHILRDARARLRDLARTWRERTPRRDRPARPRRRAGGIASSPYMPNVPRDRDRHARGDGDRRRLVLRRTRVRSPGPSSTASRRSNRRC